MVPVGSATANLAPRLRVGRFVAWCDRHCYCSSCICTNCCFSADTLRFVLFSCFCFVTGFTFDDVIALPGSIDFGVEEVALDTRITRNIPMVSYRA